MHITIHGWQYDTRTIWTHLKAIPYNSMKYSSFFCLFVFSKNGGKENAYSYTAVEEVEKLDTLNYTNIQFEASFQSVWSTNIV